MGWSVGDRRHPKIVVATAHPCSLPSPFGAPRWGWAGSRRYPAIILHRCAEWLLASRRACVGTAASPNSTEIILPFMPAPVANESVEDRAQQMRVIAVQKAASPERIALASPHSMPTLKRPVRNCAKYWVCNKPNRSPDYPPCGNR